MKNISIFGLIFVTLILINVIYCEEKSINIPELVTSLNKDNFKEFVEENKNLLVVFYDSSRNSKQIVEGLGSVALSLKELNSDGKIAVVNVEEFTSFRVDFLIQKLPKLLLFSGDLTNFSEYPFHLTGKEKEPMISLMLSRNSPLYFEFSVKSDETLEKSLLEFDLENKIFESNSPVVVYYGKLNTKRTEVFKNTLSKLREKGILVKAYIIYVKFKSEIGLHIYRLPDPERPGIFELNPKIVYKSPMRILGLLEWTSSILSIYIESCIRPYVSFRGNELMYIHESSNSLITYLKGSNELDRYGSPNVEYLNYESMEQLRKIAKENFFPEDPDKDIMVGLILPGLEENVELYTGFYRNEHLEKQSYLLKYRNQKFDISSSGKANKYIISQEDILKGNFKDVISEIRKGQYPIFYKYKRADYSGFSKSMTQYLTTPFSPLELNSITLREYLGSTKDALFVLFYSENSSKCRQLFPLWKRLAKNFVLNYKNDSSHIFISLYDIDFNDIPFDLTIEEIPTIYYFPFGDEKFKNKVKYIDLQNFEVISSYLEDQISIRNGNINKEVRDENIEGRKDEIEKSSQEKIKDEL